MTSLISRLVLLGLVVPLGACLHVHVDPLAHDPPYLESAGAKAHRAMKEIREIGTAILSYVTDEGGVLPTCDDSRHEFGALRFCEIHQLAPTLQNYLANAAAYDPWGSPYLYWVDDQRAFAIVSLGSDKGLANVAGFEDAISAAAAQPPFFARPDSDCLEAEIIYLNGRFIRRPASGAAECSHHPAGRLTPQ